MSQLSARSSSLAMRWLLLNNSRYFDKLHVAWGHERFLPLSPFYLTRKRLIMQMIEEIDSLNLSVLDIGCGIGDLLSTLRAKGFSSHGVDLSIFALRAARFRVKDADLIQADARFLPYRSSSYGAILCSEVLEHIQRDDQVVEEIHRILAENGVAIVTVPQGEQHWTEEDREDGHLRRYSKTRLVRMFEPISFRIEDLICWGFPMAVIFRKMVSTPIFSRRLHERASKSRLIGGVELLLRFVVALFRIDDVFSSLHLGLGLILKARRMSKIRQVT